MLIIKERVRKIYFVWELGMNLLEVFIWYKAASMFFEIKCRVKTLILILVLFWGLLTAKSVFGWVKPSGLMNIVMTVILLIFLLVAMGTAFKGDIRHKILFILSYFVSMSLCELIVMGVLILVNHTSVAEILMPTQDRMFGMVTSRIILVIVAYILDKKMQQNKGINKSLINTILVILCTNFVLIFAAYILYNNITYLTKEISILFIICCIFLMTVLSIFVCSKLFQSVQKNLEDQLRLQYMQMQLEQDENMEVITKNLRQLRHDMNNHIGVLYGLCDTGQYESLNQYLKQIQGDIKPANDIVVVESKVLSIILNNKKSLAIENGIRFENNISVKKIELSDIELSSLLGNILDNAIEACFLVKEEDRWIELCVQEKEDGWRITCKNPYTIAPIVCNCEFISTKENKEMHGIGTKALKKIIERQDGFLDYQVDEDIFTVDIYLPRNFERKGKKK